MRASQQQFRYLFVSTRDGLQTVDVTNPEQPRIVDGALVPLKNARKLHIARTFAYGGHAGQPMHNPELAPIAHATFADYKTAGGTTINHFYEKLLLLKDRMQTATGRQLAAERHAFMQQFLDRFHLEWRGEA